MTRRARRIRCRPTAAQASSLADASSTKEALQENIWEIRIPKKGAALLEPRPEGLLNRVFLLVTPRGVDTEAQLFSMKVAV